MSKQDEEIVKEHLGNWLNLLEGDSGQSMVEYLLLAAFVALAALSSVKSIGTWLTELFAWLGYASHYLTN